MAEEGNDGQEKTEDPSQRKIDKSLEEGKVLKSQEVNIFTSLAGGGASRGARDPRVVPHIFQMSTFFQKKSKNTHYCSDSSPSIRNCGTPISPPKHRQK